MHGTFKELIDVLNIYIDIIMTYITYIIILPYIISHTVTYSTSYYNVIYTHTHTQPEGFFYTLRDFTCRDRGPMV